MIGRVFSDTMTHETRFDLLVEFSFTIFELPLPAQEPLLSVPELSIPHMLIQSTFNILFAFTGPLPLLFPLLLSYHLVNVCNLSRDGQNRISIITPVTIRHPRSSAVQKCIGGSGLSPLPVSAQAVLG